MFNPWGMLHSWWMGGSITSSGHGTEWSGPGRRVSRLKGSPAVFSTAYWGPSYARCGGGYFTELCWSWLRDYYCNLVWRIQRRGIWMILEGSIQSSKMISEYRLVCEIPVTVHCCCPSCNESDSTLFMVSLCSLVQHLLLQGMCLEFQGGR